MSSSARLLVTSSLLGLSCHSSMDAAPSAPEPPLPLPVAVAPAPSLRTSADAIATRAAACTELETRALKGNEDFGSLQNLRVAAASQGPLVTWERNSVPRLGDTSQVGFATFMAVHPGSADVLTSVSFPARSYASSVYTTLGPTVVGGSLNLFTYGVAGAPNFATYTSPLRAWQGLDVFVATGPAAFRTAVLPVGVAESLAVAGTAPLAVVAGTETPCESYYQCEAKYALAMRVGLTKSVRAVSMVSGAPTSEVLYRGTSKVPARTFVPAIAAGTRVAFAVYRVDSELEGVWLSLDGKPLRRFEFGPSGDVGAPAVTFRGEDAFATWAARADKEEPYRLWIARVGASGAESPILLDTGHESAFAPAIVAASGKLMLAWMEGNDGTRGRIRLGVLPMDSFVDARAKSFAEIAEVTGEGNQRDPELASVDGRVYLVWSDFTETREGVPMLRTLSCP